MKLTNIAATCTLILVSASAMAVPSSGLINFRGEDQAIITHATPGDGTGSVTFAGGQSLAKFVTVKGDFTSYFSKDDFATFFDFGYGTNFISPTKIWEATATVGANFGDTLSFSLDSIDKVEEDFPNLPYLQNVTIGGLGKITDGTDTEYARWNITLNGADSTFSWSSSTIPVPEPGFLALIGIGLTGLGIACRKSKAA
ncbi:MAG: PEP-CTERM sorting domain-containing protein [Gammaproteobacteria bacterium]